MDTPFILHVLKIFLFSWVLASTFSRDSFYLQNYIFLRVLSDVSWDRINNMIEKADRGDRDVFEAEKSF